MSDANDNVQLNPGVGGATIATDVVGGNHYQIVKVAYGADNTALDVTRTVPLPVSIEQIVSGDYANPYLAVAGSTNGIEPVLVAITGGVTLSVNTIGVSGGSLDSIGQIIDGVSADVRTIAAGLTLSVLTTGSDTVSVASGVVLGSPSDDTYIGDVDIRNTTLASSLTVGKMTNIGANGVTLLVSTSTPLQSGIRIKNIDDAGGTTILVGTSGGDGWYHLEPVENVFIEVNDLNLIGVKSESGTGQVSWLGS